MKRKSPKLRGEFWTPEELEELIEFHEIKSQKWLMDYFNRSFSAVQHKLRSIDCAKKLLLENGYYATKKRLLPLVRKDDLNLLERTIYKTNKEYLKACLEL